MADERKRVLVVDDEPQIVDMLASFFAESADLEVETVGDGAAALSAIGRQRPDVVILDVSMPGMDGLALLKLIRNLDVTIPVIMLTATDTGAEVMRNGAFAFIPKPPNMVYVEHLVRLALQARRSR